MEPLPSARCGEVSRPGWVRPERQVEGVSWRSGGPGFCEHSCWPKSSKVPTPHRPPQRSPEQPASCVGGLSPRVLPGWGTFRLTGESGGHQLRARPGSACWSLVALPRSLPSTPSQCWARGRGNPRIHHLHERVTPEGIEVPRDPHGECITARVQVSSVTYLM
jgi:hypothetical protein